MDVLPDLDRPRVTVFLEAPGMAPEEVEALVTLPVETALNGATGVSAVRSNSAIGLGMVFVEFDYGTDIFTARQIVSEKLQTVGEQLPTGITPVLGPISSVMGQIMLVGLSGGKETNAADLRTLANYTVRQRLLSIPGVAQVIPIGGDNLQYQVLLDMPRLNATGLTVNQVEEALRQSNLNTTGNFFDRNGSEVLIRNLGRLRSVEDIENIIVGYREQSPVTREDRWPTVEFGARFKRGDGSVNGKPAVILSIEKQPGASHRGPDRGRGKSPGRAASLPCPRMCSVNTRLFKQSEFIESSHYQRGGGPARRRHPGRDRAVCLPAERAHHDSSRWWPFRYPCWLRRWCFALAGISINTMTLGGLAIAIGELVDDAIVDVENVFRRLRENRQLPKPRPALQVIYAASSEVRNSIVYATIIVVLVFLPLFALSRAWKGAFSRRWAWPTSPASWPRCSCRSPSRRCCATTCCPR